MNAALPPPPAAAATLRELLAGNARYVAGQARHLHQDVTWRRSQAAGQHPRATVIGCSDSRVPPELVFDQGVGDLFVIRSAGHVLDPATLASLEFALVKLQTPLVIVLAHADCGAVTAAVTGSVGGHHLPGFIASITDSIGGGAAADGAGQAAAVAAATSTHLARQVAYLREKDPAVAPLHAEGRVGIVGLYADVASGRVEVRIGLA